MEEILIAPALRKRHQPQLRQFIRFWSSLAKGYWIKNWQESYIALRILYGHTTGESMGVVEASRLTHLVLVKQKMIALSSDYE